MNFDELVQKYLDNNINASEQKALDGFIRNSPEQAEEFQMMKKVELGLNDARTRMSAFDLAFINNVGENITSSSIADSGRNNSGRLSFANFLNKNSKMISMGILFLAVILSVFIVNNNSRTSQVVKQLPTKQEIIKTQPDIQSAVEKSADIKAVPSTTAFSQTDIKEKNDVIESNTETKDIPENVSDEKSKLDMQFIINEKNLQKNNDVIQKLYAELNTYEISGDIQLQALTLLRLGTLLRQINGREVEGRKNLLKSLAITKNLNNPELQGEIYGELGIIEIKSGNKASGLDYLEKCINNLESLGTKRLAYWKGVLEKNR